MQVEIINVNINDTDIKTVTKETCNIPSSSYVVYLENSGATITELTNKQLTEEIAILKEEIAMLKSSKANQSDLEAVSTVANNALSLGENAATKSEFEEANSYVDASSNYCVTSFKQKWSSLASNNRTAAGLIGWDSGPLCWAIYGKHSSGEYGYAFIFNYDSSQPISCNLLKGSDWKCYRLKI